MTRILQMACQPIHPKRPYTFVHLERLHSPVLLVVLVVAVVVVVVEAILQGLTFQGRFSPTQKSRQNTSSIQVEILLDTGFSLRFH